MKKDRRSLAPVKLERGSAYECQHLPRLLRRCVFFAVFELPRINWVQRRDSNPRPSGYEPDELTTAPLCNKRSAKSPKRFFLRGKSPLGTAARRLHAFSNDPAKFKELKPAYDDRDRRSTPFSRLFRMAEIFSRLASLNARHSSPKNADSQTTMVRIITSSSTSSQR